MKVESRIAPQKEIDDIKNAKIYAYIYEWKGRKIFIKNDENTPYDEFKTFAEKMVSFIPDCKYFGYMVEGVKNGYK